MARYYVCHCGKKHEQGYVCHVKRQSKEQDERDKFYRSYAWKKIRQVVINRDNCMCMRCYHKHNMVNTKDLTVHHIKPLVRYPELALDEHNLVTICRTCNSQMGDRHEELDFNFEIEEYEFKL